VLEFESRKSISDLQNEDYVKLGCLLLSLVSKTIVTVKNAEQARMVVTQRFSPELDHIMSLLLSSSSNPSRNHLEVIMTALSSHLLDEYDSSLTAIDGLHSHLRMEYENGRMLRILTKLGFINERPEYARAPEVLLH
jgi:PAB-dependent poly(A)-specific ribonuclease subunit 3